jgi:hypothetical protein
MKITMEEQQKRSERARLKAYYARRRHKKLKKTPKAKQAGFKNMRLVNKSNSKVAKNGRPVRMTKKKSSNENYEATARRGTRRERPAALEQFATRLVATDPERTKRDK